MGTDVALLAVVALAGTFLAPASWQGPLGAAMVIIYFVGGYASYGTIGMRLLGLRLVTLDGRRLGLPHAIGRLVLMSLYLGLAISWIGVIAALVILLQRKNPLDSDVAGSVVVAGPAPEHVWRWIWRLAVGLSTLFGIFLVVLVLLPPGESYRNRPLAYENDTRTLLMWSVASFAPLVGDRITRAARRMRHS